MSLEERGLYFEMLFYQWKELDCPSDLAELARVVAVSEEDISRCLPAVRPNFDRVAGDRFQNAYLEEVRSAKADGRTETSRVNGQKGGRPKKKPNGNLKEPTLISDYDSPVLDSPDDFQATLETLKDEHPGSYKAQLVAQYLASLTADGHRLEDILSAHRDAQKVWTPHGDRIPPDLEKWLATYSPENKLVAFDKGSKKEKSALAAMEGL